MPETAWSRGRWAGRRARWTLVVAIVVLTHGGAMYWLDDALVGWGAGDKPATERIEVAFVRALAPSAAPAPAPAPRPAVPKAARTRPPRPAASAPADLPASAPQPPSPEPVPVEPPAPVLQAEAASAPAQASIDSAASAVAADAGAAPASTASAVAPSFEWPPSTRVNYNLLGNYRGELRGTARVQWVREGERYQVHLDVLIGLPFAPLISRRMTSDGILGESGLVPLRYDETTKLPFQSPRRLAMSFTPQTVTLANGQLRDSPPGVQDSASQFVQLTWLFTTQPQLLQVGRSIAIPLALPRRVGQWIYDIEGQERLYTPLGELDTFRLKPRRPETRPRGELSAEVWIAPTLQYLPVRIRIEQDPETYVDLMMDGAPMQAAPQPPTRP
jgi:hypothetical protein